MNTYEQFLDKKVWKKCNWCQKRKKQRKALFLVNDRQCFALSHFTCICFFNCQSCKCCQLSHNYIKRDLDNPSSSSKVVGLRLYTSRTYKFKNSCIFIFLPPERSCREISKFVIWFHGRNIISSWDFYLELSGVI